MTRTSQFILRLLCGFAVCIVTAIAAFVVWRVNLARDVDAKLQAIHLAKGYVIYSVGSDGHDDGGREKPADWKSSDKTTYDITFTVER